MTTVAEAISESNEQHGTEPRVTIGIYRTCDACGNPNPDKDEILCPSCKAARTKPEPKWRSEAGPIQTKKVNKAFQEIQWEGKTTTTKSGIIGKDEHEYSSSVLFGAGRPEAAAALQALGERFNWLVTRANHQEIITAAAEALAEVRKSRPVTDNRRTVEQDEEDKAQRTQAEAARENREVERLLPFLALFGSSEEKKVREGHAAVCAVLTYDGSDMRSDYFHPHATLACELLIGETTDKRTEAAARYFAGLFPELQGIEWEWHTENYSGGHGNYLRQKEAFDLPESLLGLVKDVRKARWEITFNRWNREIQAFKGYPGKNVSSGLPQEASESTGTDGITVRRNHEHNGVEIQFPGKPSAEVIARCKAAGFRWSFHSKVWYKKYGAYAWAQAHTIAGLPLPGETDPGAEDAGKAPQRAEDMADIEEAQAFSNG